MDAHLRVGYRPGSGHSSPPALKKDTDIGMGRGWRGMRKLTEIAIRHPAYLPLTDGDCGMPHRGVTACNDIRGTMRPGTYFFLFHPDRPLTCSFALSFLSPHLGWYSLSPSTLTRDKATVYH